MEGVYHHSHHHRHATCDAVRDIQSPRVRAIIQATSGLKKRTASDVKSFSQELNFKGKQQSPLRKFQGFTAPSQDIMAVMRTRFKRVKEEVNSELGAFAGDLVSMLERTTQSYPEWSRPIEDLLIVARECAEMSPDDFWFKCERTVQDLDDRRQEQPMGPLKQIHTRILFILTRCTRLLQFLKESTLSENDHSFGFHQFSDLGVYPLPGGLKSLKCIKNIRDQLDRIGYDYFDSPPSRERSSSSKKLSPGSRMNPKKDTDINDVTPTQDMNDTVEFHEVKEKRSCHSAETSSESMDASTDTPRTDLSVDVGDQLSIVDEESEMICRICDFKIPKLYVEEHSRICTIADRCDLKGLSIDERLERVAEFLENILEACNSKNAETSGASPFTGRVSTSSIMEEYDELSPNQCSPSQNTFLRQPSADAIECFPEAINSFVMNDLVVACNTQNVQHPDLVAVATSSGSLSPQSSISTPRASQIDLLLMGRLEFPELENFQQIHELLDIVHCIANTKCFDYSSLEYMQSYLQDLQEVVEDKKVDALIVDTFGRRIEKLLQEKYALILRQIDDGKTDLSCSVIDEDGPVDTDSVHSSRSSPIHSKLKERTTIDDFEIIKPISRGAFGRVFLTKKRVTGDLFAIKVVKKADMIRKNAVENILAERNILMSVRNPFVVRFFYSFTCRDNLYLVMEYLNGGDLYSILRNLGCLDEDMARVYIAEVVLALEYMHSLNVVHRDLKPDNLLIAHDGHIKLTDFGLSKVGLINSTDDLSGPDVSNSVLNESDASKIQCTLKREQRQKQFVVGTPDYLAPEILLGTSHGPTADWWSVGVILFELLVGIPPFNAEHPQQIFDNILNRDIPWPHVPEEMSMEANDLIDKLLNENPVLRLGATGATEVKSHPFFRSVNWDMLAKQKATFIPSTESEDDTSYFACRHPWNSVGAYNDADDVSDVCSMSSCSSPRSCDQDEEGDEFKNLADFGSRNRTGNYSFSNFSYKNLTQLASINYDVMKKDNEEPISASDAQDL